MTTVLAMSAVMNLSVCADVQTGMLLGLETSIAEALLELDLDTGEATALHFFDLESTGLGLAVGPDGTLYAAYAGDMEGLVIIDPETGDVTPVGPFGFGAVSGLAFGPDGTLYGVDGSSDQLITIDPLTGEGTAVGPTGVVSNQGLTFTPDGTLYMVGSPGGGPRLYTIDPDSGVAYEVGLFGPNLWYSISVEAIGDVLYAHAYSIDVPPYNSLVTLDRDTGEATLIGGYCSGNKGCLIPNGMAFLPGTGDVDRDGDVDHDDFDIFVSCFTGPDPPEELPVGCLFLDTDHDGDIDCDDWEVFIDAWTEDEDPPSFPPCEPCEGDVNGDETVDPLDSGFVMARFGCPVDEGNPDCDTADQNGDGLVDPLDVGYVLARFGECP